MIPEYIDCKAESIVYCAYLIHEDCPETCAFAKDIFGVSGLLSNKKNLTGKVEDKFKEGY